MNKITSNKFNVVITNKKVKLTKLREAPNPKHPNNIQEGFEVIGYFFERPEIGKSFYLDKLNGSYFYTSTVEELLEDNIFRTMNSIYRYDFITE